MSYTVTENDILTIPAQGANYQVLYILIMAIIIVAA